MQREPATGQYKKKTKIIKTELHLRLDLCRGRTGYWVDDTFGKEFSTSSDMALNFQ